MWREFIFTCSPRLRTVGGGPPHARRNDLPAALKTALATTVCIMLYCATLGPIRGSGVGKRGQRRTGLSIKAAAGKLCVLFVKEDTP